MMITDFGINDDRTLPLGVFYQLYHIISIDMGILVDLEIQK
jgi:hypothetical protein